MAPGFFVAGPSRKLFAKLRRLRHIPPCFDHRHGGKSMAPAPIYNFHDARLSLVQSAIREVICKQIQGGAGPGLWADHPVLRAASAVLDGIHQGAIADAGTARATYRATRATQAQAMPAAAEIGGIAEDCLDLLAEYALAWALKETATMAEIRSEFTDNECDPGWIEAMVAWLGILLGRPGAAVQPAPGGFAGADPTAPGRLDRRTAPGRRPRRLGDRRARRGHGPRPAHAARPRRDPPRRRHLLRRHTRRVPDELPRPDQRRPGRPQPADPRLHARRQPRLLQRRGWLL